MGWQKEEQLATLREKKKGKIKERQRKRTERDFYIIIDIIIIVDILLLIIIVIAIPPAVLDSHSHRTSTPPRLFPSLPIRKRGVCLFSCLVFAKGA